MERRDDLLNKYGERWLEIRLDQPADPQWFAGIGFSRVEVLSESHFRFCFQDSTLAELNEDSVPAKLFRVLNERGRVPLRVEGGRSRLEDIFRRVVGNDNSASGEVAS